MPSADKPEVTVAICTFNRARLLRETIESMQAVQYPADRWKLVVIDNKSTDDTRETVLSFKDAPHPPEWIFEEKQGVNNCRNRAVAEAECEILVMTDDDILVEPDWLDELVAPFAFDENIAVVGGAVFPVFPDGVPPWMKSHWATVLMLTEETGPIPEDGDPMGANLAFRLSVFDGLGPFLDCLDRTGNVPLTGGETEMVKRIRLAGFGAWFAPKAGVRHQFPSIRMNFRYAVRHGFGSGRSRVIEVSTSENYSPAYKRQYLASRFITNLFKGTAEGLLSLVLFIVYPPQGKKFLVQASRSAGYVTQILRGIFSPSGSASPD